MKPRLSLLLLRCISFAFFITATLVGQSAPVMLNTNLQIRLVMNTTNSSGQNSVRIAKDPRNNQLYYLKINGDIFRVNLQPPGSASTSTKVYSAADHGLSSNVEGLAIGPDGSIYIVGNIVNTSTTLVARVMKGVPNGTGGRTWSLLARTEPFAGTTAIFNHLFNALIVSPDGQYVYVNSGARTDHGEEESIGGAYPGLRDVPLTAKIFRLPVSGLNLVLTNDLTLLRQSGYLYAEG